jgi:hypothetical protein
MLSSIMRKTLNIKIFTFVFQLHFCVVLAIFTVTSVSSIKTIPSQQPNFDTYFSDTKTARVPESAEPDVVEPEKPAKRYVFLEKLAELKAANELDAKSSPVKRQYGGAYGGTYGGGGVYGGVYGIGSELPELEQKSSPVKRQYYGGASGGAYGGGVYGIGSELLELEREVVILSLIIRRFSDINMRKNLEVH